MNVVGYISALSNANSSSNNWTMDTLFIPVRLYHVALAGLSLGNGFQKPTIIEALARATKDF